ncbi:Gfo/Idh/MocA family oxidoreductase [Jannaschia sp. LMIT008]|uniref:Gfo/Idh/MocA family protein n=1 Tax=Jannaschia maritima TaxID=3032585 RepID=UPI002811AC49|nr:Gfo/Idh/MocA family oxidoreductase [Jannaschia sp. LMIT008]
MSADATHPPARHAPRHVALVGTGFVADLYMGSAAAFPDIAVRAAWDRDPDRLAAFCAHWDVAPAASLDDLLGRTEASDLVLNLTNPHEHAGVSTAILEAGRHVYSEKPLAMDMGDARRLHALAGERGLVLASAPCSVLGESAQTLWAAVRGRAAGEALLVYAEMDDGFIGRAPYETWRGASGSRWPAADEFRVGCTVEHAGYVVTWLMAIFGPVARVVAAGAELDRVKLDGGPAGAPDYSCATLYFAGGAVARLTCSILAPHDHALTVTGTEGTLRLAETWDNAAPVRRRRRFRVRRRVFEGLPRRLRLKGPTHPKVGRTGAASMNFMLGPAEVLDALAAGRRPRLDADFALHLNEVTLAIHEAGRGTVRDIGTRFAPMAPMPWAAGDLP